MARTTDPVAAVRSALIQANDARQQYVDQRDAAQAQIDQLDTELAQLAALVANPGTAPAPAASAAPSAAPKRRGRPKGSKNAPKAKAGAATVARSKKGNRPKRGAITNEIISYLESRAPNAEHADQILEHLEKVGAAPQSAKPKPTLQSTLNRLASQKQVSNIGRNRWRRTRPAERTAGAAPSPAPAAAPAATPAPAAAPEPTTGEHIERSIRFGAPLSRNS